MVKTISTPRKSNAILLNIKINQPILVRMCGYIDNRLKKFHGNTLSQSENIAKGFRVGYFFDTLYTKIFVRMCSFSYKILIKAKAITSC